MSETTHLLGHILITVIMYWLGYRSGYRKAVVVKSIEILKHLDDIERAVKGRDAAT